MPHPRTVPPLVATPEDRAVLETLARSRTAPARRLTRARILLAALEGGLDPLAGSTDHRW
jgi:hypothetical protein